MLQLIKLKFEIILINIDLTFKKWKKYFEEIFWGDISDHRQNPKLQISSFSVYSVDMLF